MIELYLFSSMTLVHLEEHLNEVACVPISLI
jgi:hypothetical protein